MSTIDERIVSMKFDNKQFESGVSTTIGSLNKLKSGLDLTGSAKGLESIGEAANRINLNGLSSGAEAIKLKFSALQVVAETALTNIANAAITAGKNLISSLTLDPIMDGYADYGRKLTSIQTITNATGKSLKDVEVYFNQLDEYADKTIYNLDDMTSAMAKFTNAGVDLDKSVPAIKGIANMVAVAGQDAGAAQIAFYNLSQSIAGGFLTTTDYKSLNLANVATKEWKDNMIKGAIAAGTLKDAGNGMYQIKGAKEAVTGAALFNEELSKGWATTNVLLDVLGQYGDTNTAIGKKAQAAAQDVKSFSMMMDTLKASVGTTWTDTFEILIGNLDESKTLFTGITNTISGFVNASAEARNSLLQGWKDLGGRTALIDGMKNAFEGVIGVVKSLSGAFRDIFPATTSQQLFDFTNNFKSLTENFKMSESNLNNLRSTFKGLFAILDIGKQLFVGLAGGFSTIISGSGELASSILSLTGSFGEWLVALDNSIKQSGILDKIISTLAYGIKNGLNSVAYIIDSVVNGFRALFGYLNSKFNFNVFDILTNILSTVGTMIKGVGTEADSMSTTVSNSFSNMVKSIDSSKVGEVFTSIYNAIKSVAGGVATIVGEITDALSTAIKNINFDSIFNGLATVSIGAIGLALVKMIKSFGDILGDLGDSVKGATGIFDKVKGTLDGVKESLKSYQDSLKADILMKIAIAIGILAASIVLISTIDSDKLASSLTAIGALFAQLLIAMKLYTTIGEFKGAAIKSSIVMLGMSTSILIMAGAMKKLSELDWEGVMKGAVGIGLLCKMLTTSVGSLAGKDKKMYTSVLGLLAIAQAIKMLADACIKLSELNWEQMKLGLMGVGGLLAELSLFMNNTTFNGKMISTGIGLIALGGAMKVMASAVKDFAEMSWDSIVVGLKSIGILLGELALFSNATANSKNVISTAVSLVIIGGAMKILASAVKDFASMSWDSLATGLTAMGIALAEVAVAMNVMPKNTILVGAGLAVVGAALGLIADALGKFASMSWDSLVTGLTAMGISLGMLAVALNVMNGTLAGSAALLIASVALNVVADVLIKMSTLSWDSIVTGLMGLAGVFVILGVAGLVLTPLVPTLLALSAAIVLFGAGILGIGAGLALVGVGLTGMATGLTLLATSVAGGATAIVAALGVIITGVAALIPAVMTTIVEGIVAFCKALADGMPSILTSLGTIIKAIVDFIVQNIPIILDGVFKTLAAILDALIKWIPTIGKQIFDIITAILKVIAENLPGLVKAGVDVIVSFVQGITDSLPKVIDAAFKLITSFINGLADAIRNNAGPIADACLNLVDAIVDGIGTFESKFVDAGVNVVKGFVKGISNSIGEVIDAGKELGRKALDAAKRALDVHSPSKAMKKVGLFAGEGMVIGLKNMGSAVANAAYSMGSNAIDSMSSAISNITDIVNTDIDAQPVIRPVMDLTDVQNGSSKLYNMMDNVSSYGISSSVSAVNSTARSIASRQLLLNNQSQIDNVSSQSALQANTPKQPVIIQTTLQNGRVIAETIIDDIDQLLGNKNISTGRMVGV